MKQIFVVGLHLICCQALLAWQALHNVITQKCKKKKKRKKQVTQEKWQIASKVRLVYSRPSLICSPQKTFMEIQSESWTEACGESHSADVAPGMAVMRRMRTIWTFFFPGRLGRYWRMHPTVFLPQGRTEPITGTATQPLLQTCMSAHLLCFSFVIKNRASAVCTLTVRAVVQMMDDHQRLLAVKHKTTENLLNTFHNIASTMFGVQFCLFSKDFYFHIIHVTTTTELSKVLMGLFSLHSLPSNRTPSYYSESYLWAILDKPSS